MIAATNDSKRSSANIGAELVSETWTLIATHGCCDACEARLPLSRLYPIGDASLQVCVTCYPEAIKLFIVPQPGLYIGRIQPPRQRPSLESRREL